MVGMMIRKDIRVGQLKKIVVRDPLQRRGNVDFNRTLGRVNLLKKKMSEKKISISRRNGLYNIFNL